MSKIEVNAIEPQTGTTLTVGASGDTVTIPVGATISNLGTATGFSRNGVVNWDTTAKTTGFTAVSGVGYFCNTTSAAFTVTLPATPTAGDVVGICDYANTFATNNLTVGRNSSKIGGIASNATLSTNGVSITFVYVDATQGWIVTDSGNRSDLPTPQYVAATGGTVLTCGDYKTHVFTGPGTFCVSNAGNSVGSNSVEYVVLAGGGGGGGRFGGGGGAGGYRQNYPSPTTAGLPVTATAYPITVGSGGTAGPNTFPKGGSGSSSIFSSITSAGGGGGAAGGCGGCTHKGVAGGSGGGPTNAGCGGTHAAGAGNTPPVSPPQGNPSGAANTPLGGNATGGGGAGGAGNPCGSPNNGYGGVGSPIATAFFGPTSPSYGTPGPAPGRYFAGGGAGNAPSVTGGTGGGAGGGGCSSSRSPTTTPGTSGTTNTGGGGGGGGPATPTNGGAGGSGIVLIRYKFQ